MAIIDLSCLLTTILFWTSNLLYIVGFGHKNRRSFNFSTWTELEPAYIEQEWQRRSEERGISSAASLLGALAWFSLVVPILNVVWILSVGGQRRVGLHVVIAALALGGSISELLARLMMVGVENVGVWLSQDWNLDNWASEGDGLGWRTLEVGYMLSRGVIMWIDAFEWLALAGIYTLIFVSLRADTDSSSAASFSMKWAYLGLVLGVLSTIAFLADTLRFLSWKLMTTIEMFVAIVNTLILFPIWLIWLGRQLPRLRTKYEEDLNSKEREALTDGLGSHKTNAPDESFVIEDDAENENGIIT
mmetsp:Transcript_6507/g.10857  ORF Transcript_6507/g.10857 Transcript_6507/m.10857 type:complete len:303 (-) Transcript_6507:79-987(-)|eukprot:CAMPEP_0197725658 /NCGR_PEP_ID=MMETSP1434-20131217/9095_1 /TAXON_ID=265543 /ORGANISM="Minutocellus polymorphus, Strain CCMP3303" /LENGTH=302 /DNA_ID=CAMNT_0043311239 /DNA_START=166 /DNA_END=1074 /DNA_ORIENTATION=+